MNRVDPAGEGVSVVLRIYNQSTILPQVLETWRSTLESLHRPYELWVVSDASTDESATYYRDLVQSFAHFRFHSLSSRQGPGACYREGLNATSYPLVLMTSCEYGYVPNDIKKMLDRIAESDPETGKPLDIVSGYRVDRPMPLAWGWLGLGWRTTLRLALGLPIDPLPGYLGFSSHLYAHQMRWLFGVRIVDLLSDFKLYRKAIFTHFPIQSDSDFVHVEILAKANFLGCLMDELPLTPKGANPSILFQVEDRSGVKTMKEDLKNVFFKPEFRSRLSGSQDHGK